MQLSRSCLQICGDEVAIQGEWGSFVLCIRDFKTVSSSKVYLLASVRIYRTNEVFTPAEILRAVLLQNVQVFMVN